MLFDGFGFRFDVIEIRVVNQFGAFVASNSMKRRFMRQRAFDKTR